MYCTESNTPLGNTTMERQLVSHEQFNQQHFCRLTLSITLSLTYYYGAALKFGIGTILEPMSQWRQYISDQREWRQYISDGTSMAAIHFRPEGKLSDSRMSTQTRNKKGGIALPATGARRMPPCLFAVICLFAEPCPWIPSLTMATHPKLISWYIAYGYSDMGV